METKYNESEKVWSAPENNISYCGLGQAILARLKADDQHRVFEVFYDEKIQLTVGDIYRQTITVAQNFQRIGLKKGDTVVLFSMSNYKITPITFACYTIGAPVNFFETNLEGVDINHVLQQIDPKLIIFDENYRAKLFSALESLNLPNLKYVLSLGNMTPSVNEVLFQESGDISDFQVPNIEDPTTHPATLMLTSGSTGLPKIIMHSHAVMMQGVYSWWHLEPGNKVFCFSPLRWISQVSIMMQPVFFGIQRIYTSQEPSGPLGKHIIDSCKVTHFFTVPAMYLAILRDAETSTDTSSLNSLKKALIGGEVVTDALISHSFKVAPNCKAIKCYGMTELAGLVSSAEDISRSGVNGGSLQNGFMVKIIDDDNKALGPNKMGQLCIKKKIPYLGYLKNDKANNDSFLEDGWFNTGDYGFMDSENLLNIVTRYKYLVRSGGHIIIPTELENIVGSHPSVLTSVLVGYPSPENPTDEIGTIFVVLRNGKTSGNIENELRELIKRKCTEEQAHAVQHIKVIQEMPLTSCGKVDRTTLKEMACQI